MGVKTKSWRVPSGSASAERDGGHPMLFNTFDGRLVMVIHQPNRLVDRARFFEVEDLGDTLRLKDELSKR